MTTRNFTLVLIWMLLLAGVPAELQARQQDRDRLQSRLEKEEVRARKKAASAAAKYAKWCAGTGAYTEARRYWNVASLVAREDFGGRDFEKLRGKDDEPDEKYEEDLERQRGRLLKGGEALLDFVVSAREKDGEDFSREASAIWLQFFYDEEALAEEGWVYEVTLGRIMPQEDAERMATEARYQGEWLDEEAIEAHDKAHASFDDPTELSDGTMVLYSEMSLRESLRMMNYASRFRVFLLSRLGGELKLRHPDGLMPIYAAKDRNSYNRQGQKIKTDQGGRWVKSPEIGKYMGVEGETLCPVLFSPDMVSNDGTAYRGSDPFLFSTIRHELTHMVVTEGLKYAENASRLTQANPPKVDNSWVAEGLATWVEDYYWDDDLLDFRYELRRTISLSKERKSAVECRLTRVVAMGDRVADIDVFAAWTDQQFIEGALDSYAQSCAQAVFLMQHSAETREKFFELAVRVHIKDATKESFAEVFEGVDMAELNKEFRAWIDAIEFVD